MPKTQNPPTAEDFSMDDEQFKQMLYKLFPNTKNLKTKIKEMDEITKIMDKEEEEKKIMKSVAITTMILIPTLKLKTSMITNMENNL